MIGNNMTDIVYFGYEYETDSHNLENEFKETIIKAFPDVKLIDRYDDIKGYRQEVNLPDETKDNYLAWIIGNGWINSSLTTNLMMLDNDKYDELERILKITKEQFPNSFKSEQNEN